MVYYLPQRLALIVCLCGLFFAGAQSVTERSGVWLDVPFIRQEKDGCGAAVIAMVMQYWEQHQPSAHKSPASSDSSSAVAIQRELYSRQAHGIYASAMDSYFKKHGYRTFILAGAESDLRQHLEKGRPLIVALKPTTGDKTLHYVVVAGLDWERKLVLLNDPAEKKLQNVEQADFSRQWKAAGNWTLLALPE